MAAHQAPLSLGSSRQEHWSGLPFPSTMHESEKWKWSRSVVSDSLWPHGPQPTRLLHPWDSLGKNIGVGCHCLLHVMALSEIKTNIQKREIKDEPQTNGSYKIRQIIKIMEYTHIHIHPWAKSKQSNRNKVQSIDQINKGNKKLYLPFEYKTN